MGKINELVSEAQASDLKPEKRKEKSVSVPIRLSWSRELDTFRYALTLLLVAIKFGLFAYLPTNPLATTSWLLVFAPAVAVEAAILAAVVILGAAALIVAIIGGLLFIFWIGGLGARDWLRHKLAQRRMRQKRQKRKAK